ncbi:MAG: nuclear transport factor 2 family protein [Bacteroidetes bacterium]|nr:nuclear transport factor 2 family protein [Bacteroidota bacterium]
MIKRYKIFVPTMLALFIMIFYSCTVQDKNEIIKSASSFDIKQGEASILQANQRLIKAFKEKDSIKAVSCFAQDAKLMLAGKPSIEGTPNIITSISDLMNKGINKIELKTEKIWGDSSILAEEGTYKMSHDDVLADKGKYIVLWKPEAGNWKIYRAISNTSLPIVPLPKISKAVHSKKE